MKLLYFFALFFFAATHSFAQNTTIKGKITDAKGKLPVEYASVALFKTSDSTLITGNVTNANGQNAE
jgi:hypothetical protein